ncbi:PKD domain-containing protein [Halorarum halobium]|uniref:PKD domain-containing protein n=1 Tax=Halorarum halobium TaxID=3075121 RepID=UPI0028AC83D6|nr:PKD domain-containing protein [Halobaculum sp. XH14]
MKYRPILMVLVIVVAGVPSNVASLSNDPPVVDAGLDQSVELGETVFLDGGGSFDPNGEIASYRWRIEAPDGSTARPADPTSVRTRFEATQEGRYYVTLTVTDADGRSRNDTLYVDVRESESDEGSGDNDSAPTTNSPPTGSITGPDSVVQGETATFSADAYDDGRIESYAWSTGEASGRDARRTFDEPAGSRVVVSVLLTDDDGATNRLSKSVTILEDDPGDTSDTSPNEPPSAEIDGPSRIAVDESATFLLTASDPDGTVVSRSWTSPASASGSTVTHSFDSPGEYTISATVTDEDGSSATATHQVEVYGAGEPVVSIFGPDTAPAGSTQSYTLEAYDPDGGELTISWDPAQTQLERDATRFRNHVSMDSPPGDTATVSVRVSDDEGNSVTVEKRTRVTQTTRVTSRKNTTPIVGDIRSYYYLDDSTQQSDTDTIEGGTYAFSADITSGTPGPVSVEWEFNDSTTITKSLGELNGTRTSSIEHQFVSEKGSVRSIALWVEATDENGNSSRQKWTSRVNTIATHSNISFKASGGGETVGSGGTLEVTVGSEVVFDLFSYQHYKIEMGDGVVVTGPDSTEWQEVTHVYDEVGTHSVQLTSIQGSDGYALKRVKVKVTRNSYTEYRYKVSNDQHEKTIAPSRPPGNDWNKVEINHAERYLTGQTYTHQGSQADHLDLGDNWIVTDSYTEQRQRTDHQVARSDPDGSGETWTLTDSNVRQETRTVYENQYRWYEDKYGVPGWSQTGETRTDLVVVGDGHDHDRTRHEETTRGSCADRRLDPTPGGGFGVVCVEWNYNTRVWYSGHDHDGRTYYDTDYRYHREVKQTKDVWLHRYSRTTTEAVPVTVFSETASRNYWVWKRLINSKYSTEYSLTKPRKGAYVDGTLESVVVNCGGKGGHHDDLMC